MTPARILLLPGWQNSGPAHWQSRWAQDQGFQRVEQDDWLWPRRGDWMARLEEALLADDRPALLVAHSLGCHLVAGWAGHSLQPQRVAAALLVAPPDLALEALPPQLAGWRRPGGDRPLPFPSTAALSSDDPFCAADRGLQQAAAWGSEIATLGPVGHVNADSGLGDWPEGLALLADLARRAGVALPARAG